MTFRIRMGGTLLAGAFASAVGCATPAAPAPAAKADVAPLPPAEPAATAAGPPRPRVRDDVPERLAPDADFRKERPAAAPERAFSVPEAKRFKLAGGLAVILVESHDLPLVNVDLVVKSGSGANPAGKPGLAELTANLLDEGTKTRTSPQIAEELEQLGARLSTGAGWDSSTVSLFTMTENLDRALAIWADVLLNPTFPEAELARIRDNVLAAIARRKDSPPAVANVTLARVLYGDNHPYGWPEVGTEESVRALKVADLKAFYEAAYRPANAVLVVAGDVTEADVRAKIEPLVKSWRAKAGSTPKPPAAKPPGRTTIYLVDKPGAPQSSIRVGLVAAPRVTADYHELLVMNEILGGGFRRLDLELREKRGWTYGARAAADFRRSPGPWFMYGEFVSEHTPESVDVLLKQLEAMRDTDVPEEELGEAKQSIVRAFPARFATTSQIAGQMASLAVYDLPVDELRTFTKQIAAVTSADVKRMARKYLDPKRLAIVVVGDRKRHEAELRKRAEVELRDLDGKPLAKPAAPSPTAAASP